MNLDFEPGFLKNKVVFPGPRLPGFPDPGNEQVGEVTVLYGPGNVLLTGHGHRQCFA